MADMLAISSLRRILTPGWRSVIRACLLVIFACGVYEVVRWSSLYGGPVVRVPVHYSRIGDRLRIDMADFSLTVPASEEARFHPRQNEIKSYKAQQVIETENGGRIASYPLPSFAPCCTYVPGEQIYNEEFTLKGSLCPFQYRYVNGAKWAVGVLPGCARAIAVWKGRYIQVNLTHQKQEAVESLIHGIILK